MALIKERRQFLPKSIGVVRADTGAEFVARGASNLADSMINMSFESMKAEARKKGIETAQAASIESLRTLNPETGRPEAFKVPGNFGRVAQQAYEEAIEKRYISQTESDLKAKAAEFAIMHRNNPNGAANFEQDFGDFVDALVEKAAPKFSGIINNIGSGILASSKMNLLSKQLERQRTETAESQLVRVDDAVQSVSDLYALGANEDDLQVALDVFTREIGIAQDAFPDFATTKVVREKMDALEQASVVGMANRVLAIAIDSGASSNELIRVAEYIKAPKSETARNAVPENLRDSVDELLKMDGFHKYRSSVLGIIGDQESDANKKEVDAKAAQTQKERDDAEAAADKALRIGVGLGDREDEANRVINRYIQQGDIGGAFDLVGAYQKSIDSERGIFEEANLSSAVLAASIQDVKRYAIEQSIIQTSDDLTYDQSLALGHYLERGGAVSEEIKKLLPEKTLRDANTILSQTSPADDLDLIQQVSARVATDKKPKTLSASEEVALAYSNGSFIPNNATSRDAMGSIVSGNLNIPEDQLAGFFGTNDSRPNNMPLPIITKMMSDGIPPQQFMDFMEGVARGQKVAPEVYDVALNHYIDHANTLDVEGNVSNRLLIVGMDDGVNALYRRAAALKAINPQRPTSEIFGDLIEVSQNKDAIASNALTTFTGSRYNEFKTGSKRIEYYVSQKAQGNSRIIDAITPLVEIMVGSGASLNDVETQVNKSIESIFAPTDGLVTDRMSPIGGRSMHSLRNHFPNPDMRQIFISTVTNHLMKEAGDSYVFSVAAMQGKLGDAYPVDKRVTLVPMDHQSATGQDVMFMAATVIDGEIRPVPDKENGLPVMIPLSIANKAIAEAEQKKKEEEEAKGAATAADLEARARQRMFGRRLMPDLVPEDGS